MENINLDFFGEDFENTNVEKISVSDFISKAKNLFSIIENNYTQSWKTMSIGDCFSNSIIKKCGDCDNCSGSCVVIKDDIEYDCVSDYDYGSCYIRYFDDIYFSESISDIILTGKHSYHELLCSDVEKDNKINNE